MNISLSFSQNILSSPLKNEIEAAANAAADFFDKTFSNNVNVNFQIDLQSLPSDTVAQNLPVYQNVPYSTWLNASHGGLYSDGQLLTPNPLPSVDPLGINYVTLTNAEARMLGLPAQNTVDATISLNSNQQFNFGVGQPAPANPASAYNAVDAFEHEMSEALGRIGNPVQPDGSLGTVNGSIMNGPMDYFRYVETRVMRGDEIVPALVRDTSLSGPSLFAANGTTISNWLEGAPDLYGESYASQQVPDDFAGTGDNQDFNDASGTSAFGSLRRGGPDPIGPADMDAMTLLGWRTGADSEYTLNGLQLAPSSSLANDAANQVMAVRQGGSIDLSYVLGNLGTNYTDQSSTGFFLSTNQGFTGVLTPIHQQIQSSVFPESENSENTGSFTLPSGVSPGIYYLGAQANSNGGDPNATSPAFLSYSSNSIELEVLPQAAVNLTSQGGATTSATQTITGTIDQNNTNGLFGSDVNDALQLYDNGAAIGSSFAAQTNGQFSRSIQLPTFGTHVISVRATDAYGNVALGESAVTFDYTAPVIPSISMASSPTSGPGNSTFAVGGTVSANGVPTANEQVRLTDNGAPLDTVATDANGNFSDSFVLSSVGANDIEATVGTEASQSASADVTDTVVAPTVSITGEPAPGPDHETVSVAGSAVYSNGAPVTGGSVSLSDNGSSLGTSLSLASNGDFLGNVTLPYVGANNVVATVVDQYGNVATSDVSQYNLFSAVRDLNSTQQTIDDLFYTILKHSADPTTMATYEPLIASRGTRGASDLASNLMKSKEFASDYGSHPANASFVEALFEGAFGRPIDQGSLATDLSQLHHESRAAFAVNLAESGAQNLSTKPA